MNINKMILCLGLGLLSQAMVGMDTVIEEKEMDVTMTRFGTKGPKTERVRLALRENKFEGRLCPRTMTFTVDRQANIVNFLTKEQRENDYPRDRNFGYISDASALEGFFSGDYGKANSVAGYKITEDGGRGKQILAAKICMENSLQAKEENLQDALKENQNLRVSSFSLPSLRTILGATGWMAFIASIFFFKCYQK